MLNILIIEDDRKLRSLIGDSLEKYGFSVTLTDDFKNIEQEFARISPDMVILDISLPYYDGYFLCRVFRRKSKIPIIIISAKSSPAEQLTGLELGADDYITKPFDTEVLIAKVKASVRRAYGEYSAAIESPRTLKLRGLALDEGNFKLTFKGLNVDLSKNEFVIMKKFLENPDEIITRESLLTDIWDDNTFVDDNTLTVNITRVKNKLEQLGIRNAILTKRGLGYLFVTASLEDT
jgi:DNA-binding response OmpR family regulator